MNDNAKQDLLPTLKKLYNFSASGSSSESAVKPTPLWALYSNHLYRASNEIIPSPQGTVIISPPTGELDFDFAIEEARTLFLRMFPDQEFLPRAPEPHEIIFDAPQVVDGEAEPHVNNQEEGNEIMEH